jgi:hypothetical protein
MLTTSDIRKLLGNEYKYTVSVGKGPIVYYDKNLNLNQLRSYLTGIDVKFVQRSDIPVVSLPLDKKDWV